MRKPVWSIAIAFILVSFASAYGREKAPAPAKSAKPARHTMASQEATYKTFRALIDKYYDSWSKLSTDAPADLYAKDADLTFYDVAPLKYSHGWAEYKEGVQKNFFNESNGAKLTPNDDLKVTRRGNVAWTTVTFHLKSDQKDGKTLELDGRHTAIWELRGGKWLIVHEHVSAPLAQ
ncbi:MAG TPA: nuclear transport factor 2 family protein [Blastocatellia bacterium]|nr:nuclear transport factor 2 family protein [Blastocatellia bacterium]